MYKIFLSVNEADSHNKQIQYDLSMEKYWVTQCGCLQLCTTIYMGINDTFYGNYFVIGLGDITMIY